MAHSNKIVKLTTSKGKTIQYQEQSDVFCAILVKSQLLPKPVNIDELMTYCITPVPHSLGTPDGFMSKTDKSKMMHFLTDASPDAEIPRVLNETMFIEDGNALVHSLKALSSTFRETIFKILEQLKFKPNVIFSTDSYLETSVKSQERTRRGTSDKLIVNKNTLMPASFPNFLKNGENKTQLFQPMLDILSNEESVDSILQLEEKKFIMIVQGKAGHLTSDGLRVPQ